jgi:hypothetical protein
MSLVLAPASRDASAQVMRDDAASRAAWIGAAGSVLGVMYLIVAAMGGNLWRGLRSSSLRRRIAWAWVLAALATLVFAVRRMHLDKWTSTVNPLHIIGGALWLGTLFVLAAVAWLVRAFSPLALVGASLLALTGVITAVLVSLPSPKLP